MSTVGSYRPPVVTSGGGGGGQDGGPYVRSTDSGGNVVVTDVTSGESFNLTTATDVDLTSTFGTEDLGTTIN